MFQEFYLPVRRALMHPSCNPGYTWEDPSSIKEWKKDPSRKLDVLVELILWHQLKDNQPPLKVVDDAIVPSADVTPEGSNEGDGGEDDDRRNTTCDKIVVYCAFPSSYVQLVKVCGFRPSLLPRELKWTIIRFSSCTESRPCSSTANCRKPRGQGS